MPEGVSNLVERAYFMSCFTDLASAFHIHDHVTKQSMLSQYSISNMDWAGLTRIKQQLLHDDRAYIKLIR